VCLKRCSWQFGVCTTVWEAIALLLTSERSSPSVGSEVGGGEAVHWRARRLGLPQVSQSRYDLSRVEEMGPN